MAVLARKPGKFDTYRGLRELTIWGKAMAVFVFPVLGERALFFKPALGTDGCRSLPLARKCSASTIIALTPWTSPHKRERRVCLAMGFSQSNVEKLPLRLSIWHLKIVFASQPLFELRADDVFQRHAPELQSRTRTRFQELTVFRQI